MVEGKANFLTIAHVGIMNHGAPQYLSIGLGRSHYTNIGIHESGVFSINVPSRELVVKTDYVGLVSGKNTDKSDVFELFQGKTGAPLIAECPVVMECRVERVVEFSTHEVFVGEIVETYADETVLSGGKIDVAKLDPLLFDMSSVKYWSLGQEVAPCWRIGKEMKRAVRGE
ncbi:MAG: flavin reductase family protein [Desulfovibrio sp.]|nr:MAG: flavin reductase family protein [Desulfovibrio sp.]